MDKLAVTLTALVLLSACVAPLTEDEKYARQDMHAVEAARYDARVQKCAEKGRVIMRDCLDRCQKSGLSVYEMRTARCR